MDRPSVAAGDPFAYAAQRRQRQLRLAALKERYNHELMDAEERQELRVRVIGLRRRLFR